MTKVESTCAGRKAGEKLQQSGSKIVEVNTGPEEGEVIEEVYVFPSKIVSLYSITSYVLTRNNKRVLHRSWLLQSFSEIACSQNEESFVFSICTIG